jgi:hypothetical protein
LKRRQICDMTINVGIIWQYLCVPCIGSSVTTRPQPRSQGFRVRTSGEKRKPWSGSVNFAFCLANTIFSKHRINNSTITIKHFNITIQLCIFMLCWCCLLMRWVHNTSIFYEYECTSIFCIRVYFVYECTSIFCKINF